MIIKSQKAALFKRAVCLAFIRKRGNGMGRRKKIFTNQLALKIYMGFLILTIACIAGAGGTAYAASYRMLLNTTYSMMDGILNQLGERVDSKMEQAEETFRTLADLTAVRRLILNRYEKGNYSYYADINSVSEEMQKIRMTASDMVDSIYFYGNKTDLELNSFNFSPVVGIQSKQQIWDALEKNRNGEEITWQMLHEDELFASSAVREVFTVFRMMGTQEKQLYSVVMMNLKKDFFLKELNSADFGDNGYVALVGDGLVMTSGNFLEAFSLTESMIGEIGQKDSESWLQMKNLAGEKLLLKSEKLQYNGWKLVAVIPEKELKSQIRTIFSTHIVLAVFLILCGMGMAMFIAKSVMKPIYLLVHRIDAIDYNNLPTELGICVEGEMGILVQCLNRLLSHVDTLMQTVREKESQRRRMELNVVQAQINPHFLYNSLASAKSLVDSGENDKAVYMIDMLIHFFRTGLGKGRMIVPLEMEIGHIRSYLEVQKMRYCDQFSYEIDIPGALLQMSVLKLSIQPLIENAIYHGLKVKEEPGVIIVTAHRERDDLVIRVFDDGVGIGEERLKQLEREINIGFSDDAAEITYGLRNVNQRIFLRYGEGYGLQIRSVENAFTEVIMRIPAQRFE